MTKPSKTIGVIGGLGPEATLDFFAKLIAATPATQDQDHLHLIINNNPKVPNRNEAIAGTGPSAEPALVATARALERAGAGCLVMACNTAHAYEDAIKNATAIPFISMIDETVKAARLLGPRQVGILATDGCLQAGLYQSAFARHQLPVKLLNASSQKAFMHQIYNIKAGDKDKHAMSVFAKELVDADAELLVAGCTEVPLVLQQDDLSVPLIDSTDALIAAVLDYANA